MEGCEKMKPIKRPARIKLEEEPKKPIRNYHLESDIFNLKPDNSKTQTAIRGYHNKSNAFGNTESNGGPKGIRSYHLESDILFKKKDNIKEKKGIRGPEINYESINEPQKKGKIRRFIGKEQMRTYEEIDPISKKSAKYKNEPHPDNGLVYDFTNNPFRVGKTNKKLMPEKLNETTPHFEKGKKLFMKKNNEDPRSTLWNN